MKKTAFSLLLTLALCLSLAAPAFAAGGYQPLAFTIYNNHKVSFEAAMEETRTVQVAQYDAENNLMPYRSETVKVIKLRPGSQISVINGIQDGSGVGAPGSIGQMVDENHYITYYTGAVMPVLFQGKAENSFRDENLVVLFVNNTTYFVIMGPAVGSAGFTDVADTDYYAQSVQWAVNKAITNGTSPMTFSPNEPCTMAHIVTFLYRTLGSPTPTISNPFVDVSAQDYFYSSALWAAEKNLVSGSSFQGGIGCTRANVVLYLWTLAGRPAVNGATFADIPAGSDLAQAVAWAASKNITNGTSPTTFSPDQVCTRGQIVTFLYRTYGK